MASLAPDTQETEVELPDVLFAAGYDNAVRARPGERFEHLFEQRVDIFAVTDPEHLAIDSSEARLTFAELDARANQLARYLKAQGIGSGDRLALLFDKSIFSYIATLAVLKLNAAYVPLDQSFPADRIAFICEDAECKAILTIARYRDHLAETGKTVLYLDDAQPEIDAQPPGRLTAEEKGEPREDLAYIIYTSGSTGKPKGVPIDHPQIVNFIRVAAEVYGIRPDDRMYQGLTIAFDFAIEEIWVPLAVGATLVPGPTGARLLGKDLGDFLAEKEITALCCVPTLLATLEAELPLLRYIMVSGEACPQDLVARWQKPGRIFLNAYGPTEATVTATLTALEAGKPVTIGVPLPTYAIMMLDPEQPRMLKRGETGEIGIAGIGVAGGYLNRDELTQKAFIDDFIGIPGNESGHIYRTGDLGRINADGEIEYMGRIDTQVKIRGYRIELTEIESVLMKNESIAQAVVNKYEATPGAVELAAYYTLKPGVADFSLDAMVEELRAHVPAYIVPAYFERLDVMPLLPSHKADRKKLPPPAGQRYSSRKGAVVAAGTPLETAMADAIRAVLKTEEVSIEDHFFDDMGANSLLMAQFCTKLRETGLVADVSMRDTYLHPSIRELAAHLGEAAAAPLASIPGPLAQHKASTLSYVLTGIAQVVWTTAYATAMIWAGITAIEWVLGARGAGEVYVRSASAGFGFLVLMSLLPIALKWLIVGRFKPGRFPVWSFAYFRFWVAKQLIRFNPLALFVGSPVYPVYLRLLGAKVGRNVTIFSSSVPIATDLLTIGDNTLIRKDSLFNGYRARSGYIEIGHVTLGNDVWIGEATVLDIDTAMEDGTELGHTSTLWQGQVVPAGKHYHGSPAEETAVEYNRSAPMRVTPLRRALYSAFLIVSGFALLGVPLALLCLVFPDCIEIIDNHVSGIDHLDFHMLEVVSLVLAASAVLYLGGIVVGLINMGVLPRLLMLFLKPGNVYPLYGVHYFLFQTVSSISNSRAFNLLLGDSSYIVHFLRLVGWNLRNYRQTGSNFGAQQKHDIPGLSRVGRGSLVSDGLSMVNARMSSTSFTLGEAALGADNFVGNNVFVPSGNRTGDNVLLATKVMVPIEGEVRSGVGLLGSPSFEIPRTVKRDTQFDHLRTGEEFERRLKAKNSHNLTTIAIFLASRWVLGSLLLGIFVLAVAYHSTYGAWGYAAGAFFGVFFSAGALILIERLTLGFKSLEPKYCSIYDPYYWFHERHWKLCDSAFRALFNGTPLKSWVWRLIGLKVGRQLFDDGASASERTLVSVGDYVTLNDLCMLEAHTMEDSTFKSDRIHIGDEVTVGLNAFVNYDVVMGKGSLLQPDSFLMKGEQVPAGAVWGGNPARQLRA
jgi:non-ribosomal peptide synthetase-like protein